MELFFLKLSAGSLVYLISLILNRDRLPQNCLSVFFGAYLFWLVSSETSSIQKTVEVRFRNIAIEQVKKNILGENP